MEMSVFKFLQKKATHLDKEGPPQLRWLKLQKSRGKLSKSAFYETSLNFDKKNMIGWSMILAPNFKDTAWMCRPSFYL